ncbi:MAG: prepilin-type N-terminal cleavage/methylation domain-containing protein [Phascolarctobacterium sp.]|nr:prepilin-type N-terminal cleavage/methylation domain-containing protein [Phascolarctobacterium sp.]
MLKTIRKQGGFTLIEVVAAAAIIGIMATMLLPNLSGANDRVKNAKLSSDLATIDQAVQLYRLDNGTVPTNLSDLQPDYLGAQAELKDAKGGEFTYASVDEGSAYTLSGQNSKGEAVASPGSKTTTE